MAETGNPYKNEEEQENEKYSPTRDGSGTNNSSQPGGSSRYTQGNPYHKDLRDQEENPEDKRGLYNPNEDSAGNNPEARGANTNAGSRSKKKGRSGEGAGGLKKAENSPLYNEVDNGGTGGFGKLKGRAKGLLKNKFFIGAGLSGGAIITIVIILVVLLGAFKIPNLAQNITSYQFARVTRQFADSADRTAEEDLAVESANQSTWQSLKDQYGDLKDNTWGRLDQFRPSKTIEALGEEENGGLRFNFTTSITGRKILQSVEYDGKTVEAEQVSGLAKWVPIFRQIKTIQNESDLVANVQPLIESGLDATNSGSLIRLGVAAELRQQLNLSLSGFVLGLFKNATGDPQQALFDENEYKAKDIDQAATVPDNAKTDQIANTEQEVDKAEQLTLFDHNDLEKAINNGGVPPSVPKILSADVPDALDKAVSIVNPIYGVAVPLCIVYDGSVSQSGPTIDNQAAQEQSAYYFVASTADQEEYGSTGGSSSGSSSSSSSSSSSNSSSSSSDIRDEELSAAVQAENTDLGNNTEDSNPEIRAAGGTVDTSGNISAEAGASGGYYYSLFNLIGSGIVTTVANAFVGHVCPVLTSVEVAGTLGAINLGLGVLTFGQTDEAEEAIGQSTGAYVRALAKNLTEKIIGEETVEDGTSKITQSLTTRLVKFLGGRAKFAAATAGATELSKIIVATRAGQVDDGLSQGNDLANEADSGANIQQSEIERSQLFGRPLLESEVCQSNQEDQQSLAFNESKQSAYNRYLNPANAASLVSRSAVIVGSSFNSSLGTSFMKIGADLFKPFSLLSPLENLFVGKSYAAANCNADSSDYGNVQFGYSQDEENLIHSNNSYLMLQNQQQLDEDSTNGGEAAIASKFAVCFGYQYNSSGDGNFDPTDPNSDLKLDSGPGEPGSIGSLLSSGDISRDDDGNIVDDPSALCSPSNLSYNNNEYGDSMVFRFRLAMEYDTTADQLANEGGTGSSSSSTVPE
jgi:Sec-independent protein translocase protein TatA